MFERYSFVAVTTRDLVAARRFWVDQLGFAVTEEEAGHFFIVDAGGLRLCVDLEDGDVHRAGGTDPVIGLKVRSVDRTVTMLADRGLQPTGDPAFHRGARYVELHDPDGRPVILTESD